MSVFKINKMRSAFLLIGALFVFVACKSPEEVAEEHYQSALTLLEQGDEDRAIVEFRNVFKNNGLHIDAREAYASLQMSRGNVGEAFSQFLRLVEQAPDHFRGHLMLSEIAAQSNNLDSVKRHGKLALELEPENLRARAVGSFIEYEDALSENDFGAREAAVIRAEQLIASDPSLTNAHRVIIRDLLVRQDWRRTIEAIDAALEATTGHEESLQSLKYLTLLQTEDEDDIEQQLLVMIEKRPDDLALLNSAISWYSTVERFDRAEDMLRELIRRSDDRIEVQKRLIDLVAATRGVEAAKQEIVSQINEFPESEGILSARSAVLDFYAGNRTEGISALENMLKDAEATPATDEVRLELAEMYKLEQNYVGSRALVEEVLEREPNNVTGLLQKGEWLINDDKARDAVVVLRTAMGQAPNNPKVFSLMAEAHLRDGNIELMKEMMARAVTTSQFAPVETLRYARVLNDEKKADAADEILTNSLRQRPQHLQLLYAATKTKIELKEWREAENLISQVAAVDTPGAKELVSELTVEYLKAQKRTEELDAYLNNILSDDNSGVRAQLQYLKRRMDLNDIEGALSYIDEVQQSGPSLDFWNFVRARILISTGEYETAAGLIQEILKDNSTNIGAWVELFKTRNYQGQPDEAFAVIERAIDANPDEDLLKIFKAGELEKMKDFEGAIGIYDDLYTRNSSAVFIANNLASLLATHRDDPESWQRAYAVSKRFKESENAIVLDTFGWSAFRVGKFNEALFALEKATLAMPQEPTIAFHYGMALSENGMQQKAVKQLEHAIGLADSQEPPAFIEIAQQTIERLTKESVTE